MLIVNELSGLSYQFIEPSELKQQSNVTSLNANEHEVMTVEGAVNSLTPIDFARLHEQPAEHDANEQVSNNFDGTNLKNAATDAAVHLNETQPHTLIKESSPIIPDESHSHPKPRVVTSVCRNAQCRQPDPPGTISLVENHRGLSLMLHDWKNCSALTSCDLAYVVIPKAGSTITKNTIASSAGKRRKENVWLSPLDGKISTNYNPIIFTVIRHPEERVVSAYYTILSRSGGNYGSIKGIHEAQIFPKSPDNTTDIGQWSHHFTESIKSMMGSIKRIGWKRAYWNVHIIPQIEFMRGLNVSHIGCIDSINETFALLGLRSDVKVGNVYEHNMNMPKEKFASFDMLDEETKALMRELYADDFKLYKANCAL